MTNQIILERIFQLDHAELELMNEESISVEDVSNLPVKIEKRTPAKINPETVTFKHLNSFNFSKLAGIFGHSKMTIGITSANKQSGKSLVASNMAVSLASAYNQRTLLVDMNFNAPSIHKTFGVSSTPGFAEAIMMETIRVLPTEINNLFIMTAGDVSIFKPTIQHTLILRQILLALKHKFDFVIIDLSSILPIEDFPIQFINEIDGLVNVIDSESTRKGDMKEMLKHLDESQFIAHVFNKVKK